MKFHEFKGLRCWNKGFVIQRIIPSKSPNTCFWGQAHILTYLHHLPSSRKCRHQDKVLSSLTIWGVWSWKGNWMTLGPQGLYWRRGCYHRLASFVRNLRVSKMRDGIYNQSTANQLSHLPRILICPWRQIET